MHLNHLLLSFFLLVFAAGCSTVSVNYDYDPKVNFTSLKTFNWLPNPKLTKRDGLVSDLLSLQRHLCLYQRIASSTYATY